MIELDKISLLYTCESKTNLCVEDSKHNTNNISKKNKKVKKK